MGYNKKAFDEKIAEILDLDKLGLPISEELVGQVRAAGLGDLLAPPSPQESLVPASGDIYDGRRHLWLFETPEKRKPRGESCYYDRIPKEWADRWKGREITKADWLPKGAPEQCEGELRLFVLSGNPRFDKLNPYERFYLYCEQARRWLADRRRIEDCLSESEQEQFAFQEFERCLSNKLYGLDRYATIKDESIPGGRRQYRASAPQALLMFLKDCGFSYVLLKGRQAAITSTMMAAAQLTALVTPSYKGGLVVDKEKTGFGIFRDKFKSTYQFMPDWFKPVSDKNWSEKVVTFDFEEGERKSEKGKYTSEFSTYPASDPQTINSTTMKETYFDEAQKMENLQLILNELMPTQLAYVEEEMKLVRSAFVWGTGGSGDLGKGAFEALFSGVFSQMVKGEDTGGWFAIFFDAFCRPGMDEDRMKKEYSKYMREGEGELKGLSREQKQALFSAHYPMNPQDCFMSSTRTVIPQAVIKAQRDRIIALPDHLRPKMGRFEPEFDTTQKMPDGSYLPYKVRSVRWVEAKPHEIDVPVRMFRPPVKGWANRYFQGTDPIQSDSGTSKMSSVVWDGAAKVEEHGGQKLYVPTVACQMNFRTDKPKETFMQSILMGMYYANYGQSKCRELVEVEQGHNYINFLSEPFLMVGDSLIYRGMLPPAFNGGQHVHGISMKKERKSRAHIELLSMVQDHGHNIFMAEFWNQIQHIETEENKDGSIAWHTKDVRRYNDDVVFATLFSYMAWKFSNQTPIHVGVDRPPTQMVMVPHRRADMSVYYEEVEEEITYG